MARPEEIQTECSILGLTLEGGPGLLPRLYIIGHAAPPTDLLEEYSQFIDDLIKLAQERSWFFDSQPETWWDKLTDQGRQNANELFLLVWEGYARLRRHRAPEQPIVWGSFFRITPKLLQGGWPTDAEMEQVLRISSLALAGLFDEKRLSASEIIRLVMDGMRPFWHFLSWFEAQLQADLDSLETFADFLAGRSATYTDALLDFYLPRAPSENRARVSTGILEGAIRHVLVSPASDPPYPKSVLRLHALTHQFRENREDTTKLIDDQLQSFIEQATLREGKHNPHYKQPKPQIERVIRGKPYEALLLSLLVQSRDTSIPVTELAEGLGFRGIKTSKDVSRAQRELRLSHKEEDPLLTFLRKLWHL